MALSAAAGAEDERASEALVVRSTVQCADAGTPPRFSVAPVPGGVRFALALPVDNTCSAVSVEERVHDDEARLMIAPVFVGQVQSACEVVCSGHLLVTGWVRRAGLAWLTVNTPDKQLSAERKQSGAWVKNTATVHFTSTPTDAAVFRAPRTFLGRTPLTIVDEPSGPVKYFVVKAQASAEVSIDLDPGESRRIRALLKSTPTPTERCDPVLDFDCTPPRTGPRESLAKSEILAVVKTAAPRVEQCAASHGGGLTLKVSWRIRTDGRVTDAKIVDGEWAEKPIGHCVLRVIKTLRFPKHTTETPPITFPLRIR